MTEPKDPQLPWVIQESNVTQDMTDEALDCRADSGRHPWTRFSDALPRIKKGQPSIVVVRKCVCGCERHDEYRLPDLELITRRMMYPVHEDGTPAYLLPKSEAGKGIRINGKEARKAQVARVMARAAPNRNRRSRG